MQLRHYFAILLRFWVLILLLPLLVGALSLALEWRKPVLYGASARLMITQTPQQQDAGAPFPDFNLTYSWQSSEYILDDLPQVVGSMAFSEDVSTLLGNQGYVIEPATIRAGLRAETFHRSVTIAASAASPDAALAMVRGAVDVLEANGLKYWNRSPSNATGLSVAVLDPPGSSGPLSSMRALLINVGLRVALALAAAVGLAFLIYYLDDRLRGPRQAEEWTGMRVLGVIPRE